MKELICSKSEKIDLCKRLKDTIWECLTCREYIIESKKIHSKGWQLCPKCDGIGILNRHYYEGMEYRIEQDICDICEGKKIIDIETGLPPKK